VSTLDIVYGSLPVLTLNVYKHSNIKQIVCGKATLCDVIPNLQHTIMRWLKTEKEGIKNLPAKSITLV
jgi:hypothetical protein